MGQLVASSFTLSSLRTGVEPSCGPLSVSADGGRPPRSPVEPVHRPFVLRLLRRRLHPVWMQLSPAAARRLCDAGAQRLPAGALTRLTTLFLYSSMMCLSLFL